MPLHLVDIWSLMDEIGIEREIIDAIDPDAPLLTQGIDSIDFPALQSQWRKNSVWIFQIPARQNSGRSMILSVS